MADAGKHAIACQQRAGPARRPEASPPQEPWSATIAKYKHPHHAKSGWQVVNSLAPFFGVWWLMYLSGSVSYWLTLLLAVPAAGFLVRVFIIQHDCGHHSFFRSRLANDALGCFCGVLTLTPYHFWRRSHARHHVSSGNLQHRGHGDVGMLTVDEYLGRSRLGRLRYRLYRQPLVMFLFSASFLFFVRYRLTYGIPRSWNRERYGVHATNAALLAVMVGAWYTIGLGTFLAIEVPIMVLSGAAGCWLFYIQHQYEEAYWQPNQSWDFTRSALDGSSYYRLPRVLQWFTGNIGFHHIHHLNSRIPNYNLPVCYDAEPALREAVTLGVVDSLRCVALKLWDERRGRMVTFAEAEDGSIADEKVAGGPEVDGRGASIPSKAA
jgi:acyl-lipid omega-6 desaturase (Delta-12 desaturase)